MFKEFIKYHSLGNDFIIVDWFKRPDAYLQTMIQHPAWPATVRKLCDRRKGIGGDGILIIKGNQELRMTEMLIFNADGTSAEMCLNGVRCVAQYLIDHRSFTDSFSVKVNSKIVRCSLHIVQKNPTIIEIITTLEQATLLDNKSVETAFGTFQGYFLSIGNPHFVMMSSVVRHDLDLIGAALASNPAFEHGTNVHFVWQEEQAPERYYMLSYERGVGVTQSCGSGAASVVSLLKNLGMIAVEQKVTIDMEGGSLTAWLDQQGNVQLQARAHGLFSGTLDQEIR